MAFASLNPALAKLLRGALPRWSAAHPLGPDNATPARMLSALRRKAAGGAAGRKVPTAPPVRKQHRYMYVCGSTMSLGSKVTKQRASVPRAAISTTAPAPAAADDRATPQAQPAPRPGQTLGMSRLDLLKQALAEDAAGGKAQAARKAVELDPEAHITLSLRIGDKVEEIHARIGGTLLDAAHLNAVNVDGTCDGELACSTCHVVMGDPEEFVRAKAISSLESDLLESAFDVGPMSRLACQVTVTQEMDGMEIRYPGMVDGRQLTRLLRPSTAAS
jgi:ferredoxin